MRSSCADRASERRASAEAGGSNRRGSGLRLWKQHANLQTDMTSRIDGNLGLVVLRINAGWMIWAGSLLITFLANAPGCAFYSESFRILGNNGAALVSMGTGALAATFLLAILYRALSRCRAYRTAGVSEHLAVDCLAATVAALSLLGIVWTMLLASTSTACGT